MTEPIVHAQNDVAVTANQVRLRMRWLAGPMTGQIEQARIKTAEHPIRHAIAGREMALGRVLERNTAAFHSTGQVVAELTIAMDDLGRRLERQGTSTVPVGVAR
jgi:hypothetical protein